MTVVLETERFFLRELLLNDVEPLAALWSDPEVVRLLEGPKNESQARAHVRDQQDSYAEHGFGLWAVIHRDSASFIGEAGLAPGDKDDPTSPGLFCALAPDYWGAGVATEILTAVRDHAFGPLSLDELTARVDPGNVAAEKLAARLGLRPDDADAAVTHRARKDDR